MDAETVFIDIPQIPLEDQRKYQGMDVAIIDGRIVAVGHTSVEVLAKARELYPDRPKEEIAICYIMPQSDVLIL